MQERFLESSRIWVNAKSDALWSILSEPSKLGRKWEIKDFFSTGERQIKLLWEKLFELGLRPRAGLALDFGCGVGRLTQPLAERFDRVVGVDISPTMIGKAVALNKYPERVSYALNPHPDLRFIEKESIDFILSIIVLQHIPPPASLDYVREFLRVLSPRGVLLFQVPSHRLSQPRPNVRSSFKALMPTALLRWAREWLRPHHPVLPMYPIARSEIERLIKENDAVLAHLEPDDAAGAEWQSFTYCVVKRNWTAC